MAMPHHMSFASQRRQRNNSLLGLGWRDGIVIRIVPDMYLLRCVTFALLCCAHLVSTEPLYKKERALLPSFLKICRRSDPALDQCARQSLNALKPYLNVGIPELFIPPIEPLIVPEIKMDQDSGAVYLRSTYRNVRISGLSNFTLNHLLIDPAQTKFIMSATFPRLRLHARYELQGKILMMPLVGEGDCFANFTNVELTSQIVGQRYNKHGRTYVKIQTTRVTYSLGEVKLRLDNLFNGDKALGERMNLFLNENWQSLADELRPMLEKAVTEVVRNTSDRLFDTYSYDDLLPE